MLHALLEYAERAGVSGEAGFKPKQIRWLLQFSSSGEYLGLLPASEDRRGRKFARVPHLQFTGDTPMRQFLVDTAQYALLYGEDAPSEKLLIKHDYFLGRLQDAAGVEPVLGHIARTLADEVTLQRINAHLAEQAPRARPADNVTFIEMREEGPRTIVEESAWQDWWRSYWPTLFERRVTRRQPASMRCFLSGEMVEPALVNPKVKGLGDVGGNIETTLVGFDKDAFCSYGLKQSENAAVGPELSETYTAALNQLIDKQSKRLAGSKVVYWYTSDVPAQDDPLALVLEGIDFPQTDAADEKENGPGDVSAQAAAQATRRAAELIKSLETGLRVDLRNCQYRALTLSGNAGRVVVRDWMEGQFEELAGNVSLWFDDMSIVHRHGERRARPPKFLAVLGATVRDFREVSPPLETALWRSAVTGHPIPFEAMSRALARARIDVIQDRPANHARMGLLKAYLIRKEICQMTAENSETMDHPAYVCGQIMAVLARIQQQALPNVGAGVVQRYYAAACATPALVLGRLAKLANTGHLPKIDPPALRQWHDNQLAAAWSRIQGSPPITLSLEEQTLFAMGYYHKKAERSASTDEASKSENS